MKEKLVVFAMLILFLGSGFFLVKNIRVDLPTIPNLTKQIETWMNAWEDRMTTPTPANKPTPTKTSFPVSTKPPTPTTASVLSQPLIPCYRYKIPHLDGSSSNLCYSYENYQALQQLGYTYSSAKTFYDFHLKGVADYQKQYEKTGSSMYLDAKKSQQDKANEQKNIMDSTLAKMYTLEQRGFNR